MKKQSLQLKELKIQSFVTNKTVNVETIKGGTLIGCNNNGDVLPPLSGTSINIIITKISCFTFPAC